MRYLLLALLLLAEAALAEGLAGINLFATRKQLDAVNYDKIEEVTRGNIYMVSYKVPNGNVVSVNLDIARDKAVYIEYDFGGNLVSGGATGIGTIRFSSTSLTGLAEAHQGHRGFTFKNIGLIEDNNEYISFNGYPLARVPGGVVVFITKAHVGQAKARLAGREPNLDDLGESLRLDAVVLAEAAYLEELWDEERVGDDKVPMLGW